MNIILIFIIAVSLSMDAFSLSLVYGTVITKKKEQILLSVIVGLFHFFMPLLGIQFGTLIKSFINITNAILLFILFTILGVEMIISKEQNEVKHLKLVEMFLFAFAVSLDSFSLGIGITTDYLFSAFIFSIISFLFTLLGLSTGNILNKLVGKLAPKIGGFVLLILAIIKLL